MLRYSYDIEELYQLINKLDVDRDLMTARKTLRRILMTSCEGKNLDKLFPAVVKHLSSSDLVTKKLVCWFISQHMSNQEFILLSINTLVKDCADPNPVVRAFALKTITSIQQTFVLDYSLPLVLKGLDDSSSYVRRAAVMSCVTLFHVNQDIMMENGIVDKLYGTIRDSDSIVVVNALLALEEILSSEGGVVINHNIAVYLLNHLQMFSEYQLATVMTFLAKNVPANFQEALDIMNILDPHLRSGSASLFVQTFKYFQKLVGENTHLKKAVTERAKDRLIHLLSVDNPEMLFMLLDFVANMFQEQEEFVELFQPHHRLFFCRYNEPLYVKTKKIQLLSSVVTESNLPEIVEELGMYSLDTVHDVSRCAINALGKIAPRFPSQMAKSVDMLINLLKLQDSNIVPSVLNVLQSLDLKHLSNLTDVLGSLASCASGTVHDEAKPALLWLLGEYGDQIENSPYLLEEYSDELSEQSGTVACEGLLTATVKLFLKRPAECQEILGKVLEKCSNLENVDIQYKAAFYYQLLQTGPDVVHKFLL